MVTITSEFLNIITTNSDNIGVCIFSNFKRYQLQSKRISQIIAYIWLHLNQGDPHLETAQELDRYFKNTNIGEQSYKLRDLLFASPDSDPFKLMQKVFEGSDIQLTEALFDEATDNYKIQVDVSKFRTQLNDPVPGDNKWTAVMGYPPRPFISDYGQLTNQELEHWISNNDESKYVSDNPFIPLCCS
jgi:hypothetical protein